MGYPASRHFIASVIAPLQPKKRLTPEREQRYPEIAKPCAEDRILFFGPHPDDELYAAGGYLFDARTAGAVVTTVLVTDGNAQGKARERRSEYLLALRDIGITPDAVIFCDLPDGLLAQHGLDALVELVTSHVSATNPTVCICPHPSDRHADHAVLGKAVLQVVPDSLQYLVHFPPRFPSPRRYLPNEPLFPPASLDDGTWHRYLMSDAAERARKEGALRYASQLKKPVLRSLLKSLLRKNELFARRVG